MKNRKSYTEIMKSRNNQKKSEAEATVLEIYIQMILDESIIQHKMNILEEKINFALDHKDQKLFNQLAGEYTKFKMMI
jgi:uncharacterized protein YpiB (UPF0302 family)